MSQKLRSSLAFLGNLFEHYDSAIFSLLIPFLSSKLFPSDCVSISLCKGFSFLPLVLLSKPLGSLFFSWLSCAKNPEFSLKLSYVGMAIVTAAIGFLPLNEKLTFLPYIIVIIRLLQGFFSSGETINGAMYVLENTSADKKGLFSALFDASSLAGFLIASTLISFYKFHNLLDPYWRTLFWVGSLSFIPAFILKKPSQPLKPISFNKTFIEIPKLAFLKVFMASGLSYAFFSLCFTFSNGALGLLTSITPLQNQHQTTLLFLIDLLLLPLFGMMSKLIDYQKLMKFSLLLALIYVPYSFFLLTRADLKGIFLIRLVWTTLGALFSANLYQFYQALFPNRAQLISLSISLSLGSCILGHGFSSSALLIFNLTGLASSIGLLFSLMAFTGFIVLQKNLQKKSYLL
jgi:MFS family permease